MILITYQPPYICGEAVSTRCTKGAGENGRPDSLRRHRSEDKGVEARGYARRREKRIQHQSWCSLCSIGMLLLYRLPRKRIHIWGIIVRVVNSSNVSLGTLNTGVCVNIRRRCSMEIRRSHVQAGKEWPNQIAHLKPDRTHVEYHPNLSAREHFLTEILG